MTPSTRKAVYAAMAAINAALLMCTQQNVIPASWALGVAVASLAVSTFMREFGASDPPGAP